MVSTRKLTEATPQFTPLPYGLLSSVEVTTDSDVHWQNGVEFQPDPCGLDSAIAVVCVTGDSGAEKSPTHEVPVTGADPFAVYGWIHCSPIGWRDDLSALRNKTEAALRNNEEASVSRAFWTGTVDGGPLYPHLAANAEVLDDDTVVPTVLQTAATVVTGTTVDVVEGIALLESEMAECYGGVPTLHVPRVALANLAAHGQLVRDGDKLRTWGGSLVVAGAGYNRAGPTGAEPANGTGWFYATGAVKVWRSGVEFHDPRPANVVDRSVNSVVMIAERTYVIDWDCCHFAVPVSFGGVPMGATGVAT